MGNMFEAMKRLGLEGRAHLEWISAKLGDRSSRKWSPGFVEQIRALDPGPLRAE
jgi:coenzyme F420-reducing hydrogenase delta subunit